MGTKLVMASPASGVGLDEKAHKIVRYVQPEALRVPMAFNIEKLFECIIPERTGVKTSYDPLNPGIWGYTDPDELKSVVSTAISDDEKYVNLFRATIAHESGHVVQHVKEFRARKAMLRFIHDEDHIGLRLYRQDEIPTYRNPEWQAWRIAQALLMPTPAVQMALEKGFDTTDMARAFQVSIPFAKSRLRGLKLLEKAYANSVTQVNELLTSYFAHF